MDDKTIYQLRKLIKSSMHKMNHLWEGATGSDHKRLCEAYGEAGKALELVENEIDRIEDDA